MSTEQNNDKERDQEREALEGVAKRIGEICDRLNKNVEVPGGTYDPRKK